MTVIAPFFVWGLSSSQGIYYTFQTSSKIFNVQMNVIFGDKSLSSLFRILRQELITVFAAMWCCLPQQKVRKIDHVRSTCVLVGLKDVQRFSVHLLLVSFGHCRPLAASQVAGRKDMEVPHKFTQPYIIFLRIFWCLLDPPKHAVLQGRSNCVTCWLVSFGVPWTVLQASLTDSTTYLPVKAPVKLTNWTICAW